MFPPDLGGPAPAPTAPAPTVEPALVVPVGWAVLELPGLVPIGHVSLSEDGEARVERWSVAPGALPWFTSAEPHGGPISPRAVQLRQTSEPPPLAPAGTWHATRRFAPEPVSVAPATLPRVFRVVAYDLHDGEAYSSLPLPIRGRVFRSAIGRQLQEWWFLYEDYAPPSGGRVTELRPLRVPAEPHPRRAALERLWVEARSRAHSYSYEAYSVGSG